MKQKQKLLARPQQRKPRPRALNLNRRVPRPNRTSPNPNLERSKRVSVAAFFIYLKMWNCLTAWSSMFQSICAQNHQLSLPWSFVLQRLESFQGITAIKRVALGGDEAGVGDDAAEFAFVGAVLHTSGEDDVFFNKDAADVVGSELQTDLADSNSGREPTGLDVV